MLETSHRTKKNKRNEKDDKKAGNGQGSVYALTNGKWRWQVTLGYDLEGKRQTASGVCDDKTKAGIAKAKALADFARGLLASADKITLSDYAERWLKRQKGLRPSSINSYQSEIDHAMKHLGKLKVKNVKPHHIKD